MAAGAVVPHGQLVEMTAFSTTRTTLKALEVPA